MPSTDWHAWHAAYDDPGSDLSRRRRSVQARVGAWLDEHPDRDLRVVSACSGDGRDLLEVLAARPDAGRVSALLLELDEVLARSAADFAADRGLARVDVRRADAGRTGSYRDGVPADLVMICGVLRQPHGRGLPGHGRGHPGAGRARCAGALDPRPVRRQRPGGADRPDQVVVRQDGFEEVAFDAPGDAGYRVGGHRLVAEPRPLGEDRTFFTFRR